MQRATQETPDINMLLHQARTNMVRALPTGAELFLSVGCSGRWFFDWIARSYGEVRRHIGLEYYTPQPDDLPENAEWIANTCSDMSGVGDGVCDIVFSGQNFEHLWPDELVGFFLEAHRVTKPGGLLAMDSPNRLLTAALGLGHPEHTVEATVQEAVELTELAGFAVVSVKGVWLDRDPATGAMLPHAPVPAAGLSVTGRMFAGIAHPADSFIWWLEARRTDAPPDATALRQKAYSMFRGAWPERVGRMVVGTATRHATPGELWLSQVPRGVMVPLLFGPYMPLPAGRYACEFFLDKPPSDDTATVVCDVHLSRLAEPIVYRRLDLHGGPVTVRLEFELDQLEFGVEFRCFGEKGVPFLCFSRVDFRDLREAPELDLSAPVAAPADFAPTAYPRLDAPPPTRTDEEAPDSAGTTAPSMPDPALVDVQAADRGNPVVMLRERLADRLANRRN